MAKKTVATLRQGEAKNYAKIIKAVKNGKNGSYTFKEEIIPQEMVKDKLK